MTGSAATIGVRAVDYLIDCGLLVLAAFLYNRLLIRGWLPSVSVGRFIAVAYFLLRDVFGRSSGKLMLRLHLTDRSGGPVSLSNRIVRNVPIAIGPALSGIPIVGILAAFVGLADMVALLLQGQRIGDKLAGTTVVSVAPADALAVMDYDERQGDLG